VTGDEPRGPDPAGLLFRHVVEERARRLFPPGGRILILPWVSSEAATPFDAAYAAPGALDDADLETLGRTLTAALRPGAPVLLCIARRRSGAGRAGLREARARLGPGLAWSASFGLGVLLPGPPRGDWARRHPQGFGILAALESVVRRWPVFRALGDYAALEGARRADRAPDTL
jgi:hypothetical protein